MAVVYDYLAAKFATRIFPFTLEDDGGAFTDFTQSIDNNNAGGFRLLPTTPVVNDALYFGDELIPFETVFVDLSTAASGFTLTWEYWNGSTWASLPRRCNASRSLKKASSR